MNKEVLRKQGEQLKRRIHEQASKLDRAGKFKLKMALMQRGYSETTVRRLMNGEYDREPRQALIEDMEDTLASFGKAKAS